MFPLWASERRTKKEAETWPGGYTRSGGGRPSPGPGGRDLPAAGDRRASSSKVIRRALQMKFSKSSKRRGEHIMGEILLLRNTGKGRCERSTYQMLWKANDLCQKLSQTLTVVGDRSKDEPFKTLRRGRTKSLPWRVLRLSTAISKGDPFRLIQEHKPLLNPGGHTPWGMDFAPSLSVKLGYPSRPTASMCSWTTENRRSCGRSTAGSSSPGWLPGGTGYPDHHPERCFSGGESGGSQGEVVRMPCLRICPRRRNSLSPLKTRAQGCGHHSSRTPRVESASRRGSRQGAIVKELADKMKGVLSCSRRWWTRWLPKLPPGRHLREIREAQVYLASGSAGLFSTWPASRAQGCVIAVNKTRRRRFSG